MKIILLSYKKTTNGNYRFYNVETGEVIPWLAGVWAPIVGIQRIREREEKDSSVRYVVVDDFANNVDIAELAERCSRIRDRLAGRKYVVRDLTQKPEIDATHLFHVLFRQVTAALIYLDSSMRSEALAIKRERLALKEASKPQ